MIGQIVEVLNPNLEIAHLQMTISSRTVKSQTWNLQAVHHPVKRESYQEQLGMLDLVGC